MLLKEGGVARINIKTSVREEGDYLFGKKKKRRGRRDI